VKKLIATFAVAATAAVTLGVTSTPASAASGSCWNWRDNGNGQMIADCTVSGGSIRVVAQCKWAPWAYSGWVTGTYYNLTTGQCWWGIDGYHYEVR
jgi:hypothetical protein